MQLFSNEENFILAEKHAIAQRNCNGTLDYT